jgi:CRP/FNR family transcriptional regulator, anaerobic regulatory protein
MAESYINGFESRTIGGIRRTLSSCRLGDRGICGALDDSALSDLKKISRRRFIQEGGVIFHEGDEADYFFSIVFGAVKLSTSLADGRQHIVEFLYPPSFHSLHIESRRHHNAHAAVDAELCIYARNPFERCLSRHIELEHKLFEMAILELERSRVRMLILARKNSLERVASLLLMLIEYVQDIGCGTVRGNSAVLRLPLNRAEMADYLGLTLETVSRQLSLLKRRRIIEFSSRRDVSIPDVKQLVEVAKVEALNRPKSGLALHHGGQRALALGMPDQ